MAPCAPITSKLKQSSMRSFLKAKGSVMSSSSSSEEYEMLRQTTIRRNQEFLQNLGITTIISSSTKRPKPKPKPPSPSSVVSTAPLRRSARNQGLPPPPPASLDINERRPLLEEETESSLSTEASSPISFLFPSQQPLLPPPPFSSSPNDRDILGFEIVGKAFRDPSLTKIYSIDVLSFANDPRFLVAAGGHWGFISVFAAGGKRPVMSWKGSRNYISGVMFLDVVNDPSPMLLVSSANDGKVVVWDIKKQSSSSVHAPPVVAEAGRLHSGGIFSMDQYHNGLIATASKDSSVTVSRITEAGQVLAERNASGHHRGAIRGVCFG